MVQNQSLHVVNGHAIEYGLWGTSRVSSTHRMVNRDKVLAVSLE